MASRRQSAARSFANGMMLAALPVIGFLVVDQFVSTPTEVTSRSISAPATGTRSDISLPATDREQAKSSSTSQLSRARSLVVPSPVAANDPRSGLAASIQNELKRVGCYAGDADGTWNERTRTAMVAFNSSVHVSLSTEKPDHILLTLLQGHSARACWRSCETSHGRAEQCTDRAIEAKAPQMPPVRGAAAPDLPTRSPAVPDLPAAKPVVTQSRASSTTVVVAPPSPIGTTPSLQEVPNKSQGVAAAGPRVGSTPAFAVPERNEGRAPGIMTGEDSYATQSSASDSRMGLGLLPPKPSSTEPAPASDAAPGQGTAALQPRPALRVRPAAQPSDRPRPVAAPRSGGNVRNHFNEISRYAP